MPLYPLVLVPFAATGSLYPWLPLIQSGFGAATVWFAWKIARDLFAPRAALWAAGMAAFNPYAVVHDTSLQDTALFNLLMAAAIHQLLRLRKTDRRATALSAGSLLGLAMLTTARIAFFLPLAVVWVAWRRSGPNARRRYGQASLVALPILLLLGGWMGRNWVVVGAPVITTYGGRNLWVGNNEWTFSSLPEGSIDRSQALSIKNLTPSRRAALSSAGGEVAQDRLALGWAIEYAKEHPGLLVMRGFRKLWSALSAQFSPARGWALEVGYRIIFISIHALAAVGLWRLRGNPRAKSLITLLFASFAVTTFVYWAHTSHKSYLDPVLFACAASVLSLWPSRSKRLIVGST